MQGVGQTAVSIDLMEVRNGIWRMDGSVNRAVRSSGFFIQKNGTPVPYQFTERYTKEELAAFHLELALSDLEERNTIEFVRTDREGRKQVLPVHTDGYQAKLTDRLQHSFWCFDGRDQAGAGERIQPVTRSDSRKTQQAERDRTVAFGKLRKFTASWKRTDGELTGILLTEEGRRKRMVRELALQKEMLTSKNGSRQMTVIRWVYWLARPFYRRKTIWMTFDKLYKGGDCGEYFYKYMESVKNTDVIPVYVIRKDVRDYERLCREGFRPASYRSLGQRMQYLYASVVFGTHSGVPSFCGFNNWEIAFVQDLLRSENVCIQHGLSVQDLSADSNRVVNNNRRYYCASRFEIENLSRPSYDYPADVLRLCGIPRYDGLTGEPEKQILIAPTWRSYLAAPSRMGQTRPYSPDFKESAYYRLYQGLLDDPALRASAQKNGYRVLFLLHPVFGAQKRDFHADGPMEVLSAQELEYEPLLTRSALMVTDYSGVQFDFAYMRRPVVYFHPPELPPHYASDGFDYDRQGFGEICRTLQELTGVLCRYMEEGCVLKEDWRRRQEAFFAYHDRENCRRIYEDALAFRKAEQESAGKPVVR